MRVKGLTDVLKGLAGWGVPLGMIAGWMVWPALTTDFKVNTLGVEKAPPSGQKFEFEKEAVGENPEMSAGNVKG